MTNTTVSPNVSGALFDKAYAAGKAAGDNFVTTPVALTDGKRNYVMADGLCGFAWVDLFGSSVGPLGKLAKDHGFRKNHGKSGLVFWVSSYGQSYDRKIAFANAYAKVLRDAGLRAYAGDRLD